MDVIALGLLSTVLAAVSAMFFQPAPTTAKDGIKELIDNQRVIICEVTLTKGNEWPMERYEQDTLMIALAPATPNEFRFAEVRFNLGNRAHYEEYLRGDGPRAIITELK